MFQPGDKVRVIKCNDPKTVGLITEVVSQDPKFANAVPPEKFAKLKLGFYLAHSCLEKVEE